MTRADPTRAQQGGLRIERLSFGYAGGRPVIRDLNLEVRAGQVHCVLGPSGCGKTTLLRLVAGLERLDRGAIAIGGRTVADERLHTPPERRSVGMVFQDHALFPNLSVRKNVLFGMRRHRRSTRRAAAEQLLEQVGMAPFADRMPHTLSGGQQQRVALARALASDPSVMLLDEPFSNLDAELRADLRRGLLAVLRRANVATLMVTHDPAEADAVADQVTWLGPSPVKTESRVDPRPAHTDTVVHAPQTRATGSQA